MVQSDTTVRFWGVRGTVPVPGAGTVRYGGNTSCVEIRCGEHLVIFDGGTGLRALGRELAASGKPADLDLILTHTHLDHVCGLPFFAPFYDPKSHIRLWAGHLKPANTLKGVLGKMMSAPLFPVPIDIMAAHIDFRDFDAGETLTPQPGVRIVTAALNHPNGATGYRLEFAGKSVVYITDTEHRPGQSDPNVLRLMESADIAIYDCTFTEAEYPAHKNWGHSTWEEGVRLATAAKVRQFVIFHHDPDHDDAFMDKIAEAAAKLRPGTIVAQEGMVLKP